MCLMPQNILQADFSIDNASPVISTVALKIALVEVFLPSHARTAFTLQDVIICTVFMGPNLFYLSAGRCGLTFISMSRLLCRDVKNVGDTRSTKIWCGSFLVSHATIELKLH